MPVFCVDRLKLDIDRLMAALGACQLDRKAVAAYNV
jgi:hypothetical protein